MTFEECCSECLNNEMLLNEFNRLTGLNLGKKRTKIEKTIDNACGHNPDKEAIPIFTAFVYEYIWLPLTNGNEN